MDAAAVEAAAVVAAVATKQLVDAAPNGKGRDSSRALSGAELPPSRRHPRLPRPPTAPSSSSSVAAPRADAEPRATGGLNKGVAVKKAAAAAAADALEADPVATALSELEAEAAAAALAPVAALAGGSGAGSAAGSAAVAAFGSFGASNREKLAKDEAAGGLAVRVKGLAPKGLSGATSAASVLAVAAATAVLAPWGARTRAGGAARTETAGRTMGRTTVAVAATGAAGATVCDGGALRSASGVFGDMRSSHIDRPARLGSMIVRDWYTRRSRAFPSLSHCFESSEPY